MFLQIWEVFQLRPAFATQVQLGQPHPGRLEVRPLDQAARDRTSASRLRSLSAIDFRYQLPRAEATQTSSSLAKYWPRCASSKLSQLFSAARKSPWSRCNSPCSHNISASIGKRSNPSLHICNASSFVQMAVSQTSK